MYRIRFHGRGGQGIKTASRILGSGFFLEDFEVQDAPRYGAERRGAPIFAYVRASRQVINERGVIRQPDLVVIADDSLVSVPAAGVLQGLREHTVMLINSHDAPEVWQDRLNIAATVLILPAGADSEDRADLPFVGTACAAAAARLFNHQTLLLAVRFADSIGPLSRMLRAESGFEGQVIATALEEGDTRLGTLIRQADLLLYTPGVERRVRPHFGSAAVHRVIEPVVSRSGIDRIREQTPR